MKRNVLVRSLITLAIGLTVGITTGWVLWPVEYTNTSPQILRQDYLDDYVIMIAETYSVQRDLGRAVDRLSLIAPGEPERPVIELVGRLTDTGENRTDLEYLVKLAQGLGVDSSAIILNSGEAQ
jgi:hypothetical protein